MAVVVEEETAADLAPNLVVIPVPRRQPCRRPPLQAASASPKQQLDGGLLESTPPPVTAHMHRQIHIVRSTPDSQQPARPSGGEHASACSRAATSRPPSPRPPCRHGRGREKGERRSATTEATVRRRRRRVFLQTAPPVEGEEGAGELRRMGAY